MRFYKYIRIWGSKNIFVSPAKGQRRNCLSSEIFLDRIMELRPVQTKYRKWNIEIEINVETKSIFGDENWD